MNRVEFDRVVRDGGLKDGKSGAGGGGVGTELEEGTVRGGGMTQRVAMVNECQNVHLL